LQELNRKLTFVPAGHRFCGWQKPRKLTHVTYFYIDPRGPLIDPELRFAESEFMPRLFFFDHDLWETALKLKAQAVNRGAGQRQHVEALTVVLMHELLRLNSGAGLGKRPIRGGLAGWQEKKVAEYIEEHLAEDISLATLADVARLSPYHFVRGVQAVIRSAAASLFEQHAHPTGQVLIGESRNVGDADRPQFGF
jgi:AraC family transcriptional regulator